MTVPRAPASSGTPPAEVSIDDALVRDLLRRQHPDLAGLPITAVASGWDNAMFRLGGELAVRLPRRELAATLILHEQRWLAQLYRSPDIRLPVPVRVGVSQDPYPWPWSVVPWLDGETADLTPIHADQGEVLGRFLRELHQPAPAAAPTNPYRGVPLATRADAFDLRVARLAGRGVILEPKLLSIWEAALAAPIDAERTWIHGDLHPRNVLVVEGRIHAVIDWGDLSHGDPATDLAAVWLLLGDRESRHSAMHVYSRATESTWLRARGWALLFSVLLLDAGLTDDPRMTAIAERTIRNLRAGP